MDGRSVVDVVMGLVTTGVLLAVPLTGRLAWEDWTLVLVLGAAAGLLTAVVAQPAEGARGLVAVGLLVVPMLALAASSPAHGLCYVLALGLGLKAGRRRFPAV